MTDAQTEDLRVALGMEQGPDRLFRRAGRPLSGRENFSPGGGLAKCPSVSPQIAARLFQSCSAANLAASAGRICVVFPTSRVDSELVTV